MNKKNEQIFKENWISKHYEEVLYDSIGFTNEKSFKSAVEVLYQVSTEKFPIDINNLLNTIAIQREQTPELFSYSENEVTNLRTYLLDIENPNPIYIPFEKRTIHPNTLFRLFRCRPGNDFKYGIILSKRFLSVNEIQENKNVYDKLFSPYLFPNSQKGLTSGLVEIHSTNSFEKYTDVICIKNALSEVSQIDHRLGNFYPDSGVDSTDYIISNQRLLLGHFGNSDDALEYEVNFIPHCNIYDYKMTLDQNRSDNIDIASKEANCATYGIIEIRENLKTKYNMYPDNVPTFNNIVNNRITSLVSNIGTSINKRKGF